MTLIRSSGPLEVRAGKFTNRRATLLNNTGKLLVPLALICDSCANMQTPFTKPEFGRGIELSADKSVVTVFSGSSEEPANGIGEVRDLPLEGATTGEFWLPGSPATLDFGLRTDASPDGTVTCKLLCLDAVSFFEGGGRLFVLEDTGVENGAAFRRFRVCTPDSVLPNGATRDAGETVLILGVISGDYVLEADFIIPCKVVEDSGFGLAAARKKLPVDCGNPVEYCYFEPDGFWIFAAGGETWFIGRDEVFAAPGSYYYHFNNIEMGADSVGLSPGSRGKFYRWLKENGYVQGNYVHIPSTDFLEVVREAVGYGITISHRTWFGPDGPRIEPE